MVVVPGGGVVAIARLALTLPPLAGANWIVMGCVCPGAKVNGIGPPTRVKGEVRSNWGTVPDSIPIPEFRRVTVLVVAAPGLANNAILPGAESFPACTIPLTTTCTYGRFGSPLLIGRVWLAIPITFGVKRIVTGTLVYGGKE